MTNYGVYELPEVSTLIEQFNEELGSNDAQINNDITYYYMLWTYAVSKALKEKLGNKIDLTFDTIRGSGRSIGNVVKLGPWVENDETIDRYRANGLDHDCDWNNEDVGGLYSIEDDTEIIRPAGPFRDEEGNYYSWNDNRKDLNKGYDILGHRYDIIWDFKLEQQHIYFRIKHPIIAIGEVTDTAITSDSVKTSNSNIFYYFPVFFISNSSGSAEILSLEQTKGKGTSGTLAISRYYAPYKWSSIIALIYANTYTFLSLVDCNSLVDDYLLFELNRAPDTNNNNESRSWQSSIYEPTAENLQQAPNHSPISWPPPLTNRRRGSGNSSDKIFGVESGYQLTATYLFNNPKIYYCQSYDNSVLILKFTAYEHKILELCFVKTNNDKWGVMIQDFHSNYTNILNKASYYFDNDGSDELSVSFRLSDCHKKTITSGDWVVERVCPFKDNSIVAKNLFIVTAYPETYEGNFQGKQIIGQLNGKKVIFTLWVFSSNAENPEKNSEGKGIIFAIPTEIIGD